MTVCYPCKPFIIQVSFMSLSLISMKYVSKASVRITITMLIYKTKADPMRK